MLDQDMQKVTVELPRRLLESVKESTGLGTTEILRQSLKEYAARQAQLEFIKLRGTHKFSFTIEELRAMDDE